jgi:hypothetical protein
LQRISSSSAGIKSTKDNLPSFSTMLTKSTIAVLLMIAGTNVRAGINLTPLVTDYVAEGIKIQQLTFNDDKRRVEYEPPKGWNFDGSPNQLHFRPTGKNFAEAFITVLPLAKPQPLDDNAVKAIEQQVIAALPAGSQFAKVEDEVANAVLLGGNAGYEVTVSYQMLGEKFFTSELFVNLPDTQLVFRLTARKDDFQALHREFKGSIFSWHWVGPDPERPEIAKAVAPASVQ